MDSVLVYENPLGCRDKIAVLYLDAHVEYADKAKFKADLKKTYERLGQPMPEVKFMGEGNLGNGHKISTKPVEPNKPK
jgi:succinyl-CoA synthetase beta subunit